MNRPAALLCLLLAAACERAPEEPAAAAPAAPPPIERLENDNLLNLVFGAAVIDRSYELNYETSAAQVIDGTPQSNWTSAPGGRMVATLSLAAPTRLTRLGATVPKDKSAAPERIRFEASMDGKSWRTVLDTPLRYDVLGPQLFDIEPVDVHYLRMTATEPHDYYSHISSLYAIGSETAPFVQPPIEGCWEINNVLARFARHGARVAGTIGGTVVDGGSDGRVYRFMWLEQAMWGYAAVSVSPDGMRLSGVRWHEEVNPAHNGDGWLGKRVPCTTQATIDGARIVDSLIRRSARWRLYGVRLDAGDRLMPVESESALDLVHQLVRTHPRHRFVIAAREYRASSEERNRARCQAKLEAVRAALAARGTDLSRVQFTNAGPERHELAADFTTQRAMDSALELQVLPLQ